MGPTNGINSLTSTGLGVPPSLRPLDVLVVPMIVPAESDVDDLFEPFATPSSGGTTNQ